MLTFGKVPTDRRLQVAQTFRSCSNQLKGMFVRVCHCLHVFIAAGATAEKQVFLILNVPLCSFLHKSR
jgi:hypothetical protein